MATMSFTSPATQGSDADFTARINEFFSIPETLLVHVPQTGEMTYPAVSATRTMSTIFGWRMYRFNDALQATSPVYIKLSYGCANGLTAPAALAEVGTAVDGSGNFMGTSTSIQLGINSSAAPAVGSFTSYACYEGSCFWMSFKHSSMGLTTQRPIAGVAVFRSTDSSGNPTGTSVTLFRAAPVATTAAPGNMSTLRIDSPGGVYSASNTYSVAPGARSNSGGLGGEIEAYLCYYIDPKTKATPYVNTIYPSEFPTGTVFTATMVGTTPRTYISLGTGAGNPSGSASGHALVWE